MEFLLEFLPIIIYILLIILLITCIYLFIRAIGIMNKFDYLLDDVKVKIDSLNGFFRIINFTSDKVSGIAEKIVDAFASIFTKLLKKRKEEDEDE